MILVGLTEISNMLGVSRQRAAQLAEAKDFPAPHQELAQGRVWSQKKIETWAGKRGRTLAVRP